MIQTEKLKGQTTKMQLGRGILQSKQGDLTIKPKIQQESKSKP